FVITCSSLRVFRRSSRFSSKTEAIKLLKSSKRTHARLGEQPCRIPSSLWLPSRQEASPRRRRPSAGTLEILYRTSSPTGSPGGGHSVRACAAPGFRCEGTAQRTRHP